MKIQYPIAALVALALVAPAAAEEPCYTTSPALVTVPETPLAPAYYLANDLCQPVVGDGSCLFSIWPYWETNGIPGLQRGDEVRNDVENCVDGTQSDTFY